MSLSFDYTDADAEFAGTGAQVQDVPESLFKVGLELSRDANTARPERLVAATSATSSTRSAAASAACEHGDYTTVDASAGYYFDQDRHHRIGVRLENALDEDYVTSVGRGIPRHRRLLRVPQPRDAAHAARDLQLQLLRHPARPAAAAPPASIDGSAARRARRAELRARRDEAR